MQRREFLAATAALPAAGLHAGGADKKPLRVGRIGSGWYGKCSLFRLFIRDTSHPGWC